MIHTLQRLLAIVAVLAISVNVSLAGEKESIAIIDAFIKSIESNEKLDKEKSAEVLKLVKELRDDEYARSAAITEGLIMIYPEFGDALNKIADDDIVGANKVLETLVDSDDKFLAAESNYFIARGLMFEQQFEAALPKLELVLKSKQTVQLGNATYFKGVAQANLLDNKGAIKTLQSFVKDFPAAPERMRISALRQVDILNSIKPGTLADVFQRMNFSQKRLESKDTGKKTKDEQDKIVAMLTKMIKKAEDDEKG